jgi:hypothetical protein
VISEASSGDHPDQEIDRLIERRASPENLGAEDLVARTRIRAARLHTRARLEWAAHHESMADLHERLAHEHRTKAAALAELSLTPLAPVGGPGPGEGHR